MPHCLRPSQTCPGKYNKKGLDCRDDCPEDCVVGRLRKAAIKLGYKGVCIAPGGALALRFVKETMPQAIIAIACQKELEEGVAGVKQALSSGNVPPIVIIPLVKDGCVDTEVDEPQALRVISTGYKTG